MESNRDQASHANYVAREDIEDNAQKFSDKSRRIYPTDQAEDLPESIESGASGGSKNALGSSQNQNGNNRNRKRVPSPNRAPECTPANLEVIERISKCKTYYEVLEVDKENFSEIELEEKYRKLALLGHPDKISAAGAADALLEVGKAYGVLSDHQKKAEYDSNMNRPAESGQSPPERRTHPIFDAIFNGILIVLGLRLLLLSRCG